MDDRVMSEKNAVCTAERTIKERFRGFMPVVVDVETAGFNPQTDALIEVGMMTVRMDGRGIFSPGTLYHANIRPFEGAVINRANIEFLGVDPFDETRDLRPEGETLLTMFKAVGREVRARGCRRAILVGHNAHFDQGFINAAALRNDLTKKCPFHPFSVLDTATLSALVYGQTVLARACRMAGIDYDEDSAHDAGYDTLVECRLFCGLMNRYSLFAGFPGPCED